ncbi:MAG: thiamine-phosphate kinase, partial [Acidobacteria bacterium]|nr:thiamine-phosphate kinase [Acidobacteriota bacterium]
MTVAKLGEHALLARIRSKLPRSRSDVLIDIGDDAAIVDVARNEQTVLTTDALVEDVHFCRQWSSPGDIGHKALAVNLSDLAAMGATPRWVLLSLVLPGQCAVEDVEELVASLGALAQAHGLSVVGGNLARTDGPMVVDVTAIGTVRPRRALSRSGGRPGDDLYVSGTIGAAAAGVEMLRERAPADDADLACLSRHRRPEPRVALGLAMGRARAVRAAMDLSDGLADAVRQVASASACGAIVEASALPIDPGAARWWQQRGRDAVLSAVAGGDDYELLLAAPPAWRGRLRAARR